MNLQQEFQLDKRQVDLLFSHIRSKNDLINRLMESVKIMLINDDISETLTKGKLLLYSSKNMRRLFYFSENKYFSINFPFSINTTNDNCILNFFFENTEIEHRIISDINMLLKTIYNSFSDFWDAIAGDVEDFRTDEYMNNLWNLLQNLFLSEDGYIRYDYDEANEKETYHPLNHLDVFYSNMCTFKLGLKDKISEDDFVKLLDIGTPVSYLEK